MKKIIVGRPCFWSLLALLDTMFIVISGDDDFWVPVSLFFAFFTFICLRSLLFGYFRFIAVLVIYFIGDFAFFGAWNVFLVGGSAELSFLKGCWARGILFISANGPSLNSLNGGVMHTGLYSVHPGLWGVFRITLALDRYTDSVGFVAPFLDSSSLRDSGFTWLDRFENRPPSTSSVFSLNIIRINSHTLQIYFCRYVYLQTVKSTYSELSPLTALITRSGFQSLAWQLIMLTVTVDRNWPIRECSPGDWTFHCVWLMLISRFNNHKAAL